MDAFEALADPTRRQIVAMLAVGERSAGTIARQFDIAESGLIAYRREATTRFYRLEPEPLEQVRQWMDAQLDLAKARFDRLGVHLDRMKAREDGDG